MGLMFEWLLGNQDSSAMGPVGFVLQFIFYVLACVLIIIAMLNLLISIIGDTNTRVVNAKEVSMY